jgi:molecular chaperone GrpE
MSDKDKKSVEDIEKEENNVTDSETESDLETYEKIQNEKIDLQSFADEQGEEYAKKKGLNIFGRKKKKDEDASSKHIEKLTDLLEEKNEKIKQLETDLKAMVAENRNQKNRIENEYRSRIKFAVEDFFRDFVTVKDDFDKAMEFLPEDESNPFIEGIKNLHKKMENVMVNHGLTAFSALGKIFDPNIHQAMSIIDVEGKEVNEIVAQYVKGYKYHERLLRAAMVVVASGKTPETENEIEEDNEDNEDNKTEYTAAENVEENSSEDLGIIDSLDETE